MTATSMTSLNITLLLIVGGLSPAFGQQNYSNTIVNNSTGKPLNMMDIGSPSGIVGSLYLIYAQPKRLRESGRAMNHLVTPETLG